MKIAGREIKGPNRVTMVLPRENGDDIVIIAEAILDMGEMDKYLEAPKPPAAQTREGIIHDYSDKGYQQQLTNYNLKKMAWMVLKSLEPSNIEWETVDIDKPSSWLNYQKEMKEAGFSDVEINRVCQIVMQANALDESKLEAAREVFLRGRVAEKDTSGQNTPAQTS